MLKLIIEEYRCRFLIVFKQNRNRILWYFFLELCVLYAYHAAGRCKIYNRHGAAAGGILAVSDVSE